MSEISNAFKSMDAFNDGLSERLFYSTLTIINNQKFMQSQIAQLVRMTDIFSKSIGLLRPAAVKAETLNNDSDKKSQLSKNSLLNKLLPQEGMGKFFSKSLSSLGIAAEVIKLGKDALEKMYEINSPTAASVGLARGYGLGIETWNAWDSLGKSFGFGAEYIGDIFLGFKKYAWQFDNLEYYPEKQNALDTLGIKLDDLTGSSDLDKFKILIDKIVSLKDDAAASQITSELLGGDAVKLVNYLRSTGNNFTENIAEEQRYSVLSPQGADGAYRFNTAIDHLLTFGNSFITEAMGRTGGFIAPVIEGISPKKPKQLLTEEEERREKGLILQMYSAGPANKEEAKEYAHRHGLGNWYDKDVDQPGTFKKLWDMRLDAMKVDKKSGGWSISPELKDKLVDAIDGESNNFSLKPEKEESSEQQSITPKTNNQPKDYVPFSTTLSQASPENLRPIINDQSNKSVDIHIYAAAGQSEMDIANNIVARVNDLDIFNGTSGNNAMYDVAVA